MKNKARQGETMDEKIKQLEKRVDKLYTMLYAQSARAVNRIIMDQVTDTDIISEELERLLDCIEDERFYNQFWKLIQYTEKFDTDITAEFRRAEKVLTTGL